MLSDVRLQHVPDQDDDWIEFVFERIAPDRLFESKSDESWWRKALEKLRAAFRR